MIQIWIMNFTPTVTNPVNTVSVDKILSVLQTHWLSPWIVENLPFPKFGYSLSGLIALNRCAQT